MKLKLITTETFGNVPCDFYRNMNDEMLLTRNQIGQALEYKNPQKAIDNIHSKHKDRLDNLSVTTKLRATDGKEYFTTLYTQQSMTLMQQDIKELKESSNVHAKSPSSFYMRMKDKYKLLQEHYNCTRAKLYSEIYKELEDTYDIDLNQIREDYCYENRINRNDCYIMDAIEHTPQLRDALELLVNTTLIQNNLMTEEQVKRTKRETIFSKDTNKE